MRHAIDGTVRILWKDYTGEERISNARLVNVSEAGLQLLLGEQVPLSTVVTCDDPKLGIEGKGLVRYCKFSKGEYLVGLEFSGGTGWKEPFVSARLRLRRRLPKGQAISKLVGPPGFEPGTNRL